MYRTDLVKERPTTWAQFFKLFAKHPRKLTLLDSPAEVIGSVAVMLGYSFNTDDERELDRARAFLLDLKPNVHSFDSTGYESSIVKGSAFGGLGWNGDGLAVIARSPKNAAAYVVPEEGCELWVDAYVVPKRATNAKGAHAWIDFVYEPKSNALETAYTYFGSPLKRGLLAGVLTPAILKNPDIFPPPKTMRRLEPSAVTAAGMRLRERIWAEIRR
jgi:spermidine/putrescine transport system substrate-binding protein